MSYLNAQMRLAGDLQAASAELMAGTLRERGRGFASDREAWAQLKELIEDAKEKMKNIEQLHKDMWRAVKEHNPDAFCAMADEFRRAATQAGMEWITGGVLAHIAVLGPEAYTEEAESETE